MSNVVRNESSPSSTTLWNMAKAINMKFYELPREKEEIEMKKEIW